MSSVFHEQLQCQQNVFDEVWVLNNWCCYSTVSGDTFPTLSSLDKSVGRSMEQRVNLKFLVKLGKTFTEAYAMLKEVYGNECLSRTQVFEWFKRFKEGPETTEDDPRHGRLSTSKTDENIEKIAKMVPKLLTPKQKESRMNICADILNNIDADPGLLDAATPKRTRFESVEAVRDFQHCFQQWKSCMERSTPGGNLRRLRRIRRLQLPVELSTALHAYRRVLKHHFDILTCRHCTKLKHYGDRIGDLREHSGRDTSLIV
ncbi:hypothetical protein NQ318_002958 [Aromia moschata]|uniref:Mos1 transposase HTH domain-containing protein n=1 Tax=Aromia moschata TaxID=1265417 RepID=A0AAV8YQC1_9CUCU|nr:hypothetical protein NQ318_002958 [Aromia moschata]